MVGSKNKAPLPKPFKIFEFVNKNFAFVSALIVIVAYFCATLFLYAYLSFFDWRLIWVIEYSDVLKVGMLTLSIISTFLISFWALADDLHVWREKPWEWIKTIVNSIAGFTVLSLVVWLVHEYGYQEPMYFYYILLHASWLMIVLAGFSFIRAVRIFPNYSARDVIGDVVFIFSAIYLFGLTFGVWVRNNDGFKHDVTLKGEVMRDVGVVLMTTHHVILYKDDLSIIVPASSVERIQGLKSKPRLRRPL